MTRINTGRLVIGGVVAGVVLFFLLGVLHGKLLNADWMAWQQTAGAFFHTSSHESMKLWFAMSLVAGMTGVWMYAGIRPRYGAGPKTALLAGFMLWLACYVTAALNSLALGILPHHIIKVALVGEFIAVMISTYLGAAIYKE